jgi:4-diphosphocytidyl-2-C-methyl-D-erythritol kinase
MNDLEAPVFEKYLILPVLKSWLLEQSNVSAAMMSGSGSTIFAILKNGADGLEESLKSQFGESFPTFRCRLLAKTNRV